MKLLVTGGCGFIGSNLVRHLLEERDGARIVNLDLLTYAGNLENLRDVEDDSRYRFVRGDVCDGPRVRELMREAEAVVHLAAESHVDRSISDDAPFVRTNVLGTQTLLATALEAGVERFVHVSSDEVYGELPWRDPAEGSDASAEGRRGTAPRFTEETPLAPRSPYAATKAAGDHLALAYHTPHGLDVVVTRCSNNFGPFQLPEKLIPLTITRALEGRPVPVYGDGLHVRDWMHVRDHCRGLLAALERGRAGRVYNFGAGAERKNLEVVRRVVEEVGADPALIRHVADRPGHDRRYAIDASRARQELDWRPRVPFEEGLRETVRWYRRNRAWWEGTREGDGEGDGEGDRGDG